MRITNNMLTTNMLGYLQTNLRTMSKYYAQAATGNKISKASEDPVIAARSLKLNTDLSVLDQYRKNAESAVSWMEVTESGIQSVSEHLRTIRTKVDQASNTGTMTPEDRQAIAQQVSQLREEIISLANTTYSGRYLFSGFKSDTPLLDENGFFNTVVSSLEKIYYEVGVTNKLQVNVTGDSLFNMGQEVGYLPARSALVQDMDDVLALLDAKASVTSSVPLDLTSPGVFDMRGVSVSITVAAVSGGGGGGGSGGAVKVINFGDAGVEYINRMTSDEIIDYVNRKLGLDATASLDKNGNIIVRSQNGGTVTVADTPGVTGSAGSAAKLFGTSPTYAASSMTGSKSMTQPTVDVSGYKEFRIIVDRSAAPIKVTLSAAPASSIADLKNARLDEIASEINRQIAAAMAVTSTATKWAKCTVEDGRLCLTSESFGTQSYIEVAGGQEVRSLFGVIPTHKQGNLEQQGKLIGSRDFREPVVDITRFRSPPPPAEGGTAPTVNVLINGTFSAVIKLDDGDESIDPYNMTLRQIMKKIDDQLGGHGTCDIDGGKLVLRAKTGGESSKIELSSIDEAFSRFLFGTDPVIKNGSNEPSHGFYKSGVAVSSDKVISVDSGFSMDIIINTTTEDKLSKTISGFPTGKTVTEIADFINEELMKDTEIAQLVNPDGSNSFRFAVVVDKSGNQVYPVAAGGAEFTGGDGLYLQIQSHTWGTGSNIKIEMPAAGTTQGTFEQGMADLFGRGTENAPTVLGGVDGFYDEICIWLDTADDQLANLNMIWTDLGARMNRAELTQDRLDLENVSAEKLLTLNDYVDKAEALTAFQEAEVVYNSSLAVGARIIQPTLMDFLS